MQKDPLSRPITIVEGYSPGAIGRVVELHGAFYHVHWGFGLFFEAKVAVDLANFLGRYEHGRDGFWTAQSGGRVQGAIAIDGIDARGRGAHLRWFIVSDAWRGRGVGHRLIDAAMAFCRSRGYRQIYLWTFGGLDAARHLYETAGFELVEARPGTQWGTEVNEQRFVCRLPQAD